MQKKSGIKNTSPLPTGFLERRIIMVDRQEEMYGMIRKLFEYDLKLLDEKIPANGIWGVCEIPDSGYHGAVRVIPTHFAGDEYALWIDVFQTIYDPIYSNSLSKGSLQDMKNWLKNEEHIQEVYDCMHHLKMLAEDE